MPAWDMSWDDLQAYGGRTPRPADFDAYWSSALGELSNVPANVTADPVDMGYRSAHCHDLWFDGVNGGRLHAKYLRPASPDGKGRALAVFHGYGWRSPDWLELLPYAAEGYSILALDCRGQGGRSVDPGSPLCSSMLGHVTRGIEDAATLMFRSTFLDTVQAVRVLMSLADVDPDRVGTMGGSQGGGLALACAALEPRVRVAVATFPFLCDYLRVWEMDLAKDAYSDLRDWFRLFDPMHRRADEIFERLGYIDVQHLAGRIEAQVLLVTCLADQICPPSTQFAAYNKIRSPKRVVTYPDFGHEDLPEQRDVTLKFIAEHL